MPSRRIVPRQPGDSAAQESPALANGDRWPDLSDVPPAEIAIFGWSYWGPTWDDDPKPWRARLVAIQRPEETDGTPS